MSTLEMKFDQKALSENEKQTINILEEEINSLLLTENESEYIIFGNKEDRISDKEIEDTYTIIYSCGLATEYKKRYGKSILKPPALARNLVSVNDTLSNSAYLQLSLKEQQKIVIWSKNSYRILSRYFKEKWGYILRGIRFDFLPDKTGNYTMYYLSLYNIRLSKTEKDPNIISLNTYISDLTNILEHISKFQTSISKRFPNK